MSLIRAPREARLCCDKCGKLGHAVPHRLIEIMVESLVREGWSLLDATGQPQTLCDICMKAEPRDD